MIHNEVKETAAPVAAGAASSSRSNTHEDSQAKNEFIQNFWGYQNYLNRLRAIHMGDIPEPDGSFYGDGIPRTVGGYPFEPLNWGGLLRI